MIAKFSPKKIAVTRYDNTRAAKVLRIVAITCCVVFCWIVYPYKWAKAAIVWVRKIQAIQRAKDMAHERGCKIFVVQNGMRFDVGTRAVMRRKSTKIQRRFARNHAEYMDYDYRYGIVFEADPHA